MASCCPCNVKTTGHGGTGSAGGGAKTGLPLICLVPREGAPLPSRAGQGPSGGGRTRPPAATSSAGEFKLLDDAYIKKNFKLPPRALYLDPFRRPLITFPMTQEATTHFNLARKTKINQQILDGFLDANEAISAPSVFPYSQTQGQNKKKEEAAEEEVIYILQLPDWEYECPVHHTTVKTPRFIWHSCKKGGKDSKKEWRQGGGPLNKPKPWLLSRHTDFDLLSQW